MTPLAQHLLNDYCRPKKNRTVKDPYEILRYMPEAKCFELTALIPFIDENLHKISLGDMLESGRVFVPAPRTFIEFKLPPHNKRFAMLLIQKDNGQTVVCETNGAIFEFTGEVDFPKGTHRVNEHCSINETQFNDLIFNVAAILFFLNTPRICGKKVHQPHVGLQRKLARASGMTGKFPLQAWTEMTLWCDKDDMRDLGIDGAIENYYSGRKCLHFVRSFLRWRRGNPERVKAHWRGDPSLGMKRTDYIAKPAEKSSRGS